MLKVRVSQGQMEDNVRGWIRYHDDIETGNVVNSISNSNNICPVAFNRRHEIKTLMTHVGDWWNRFKSTIFSPECQIIRTWNKAFLVACIVSLFVDPLFFFLPSVRDKVTCIQTNGLKLKLFLTLIRSVADVFYGVQIYLRFHTAYAMPLSSTSVFGTGLIVSDPSSIAANYLKNGFFVDLIVTLPLPQVMVWGILPYLSGSKTSIIYTCLLILICQYFPRLFLVFPLTSRITKSAAMVSETAWAGAAYNLVLSILASHVIGACWFIQAITRQEQCWRYACTQEAQTCEYRFFQCSMLDDAARINWYKSSNVSNVCDPGKSDYPFGIYGEALTSKVTFSPFFNRYFYSLWWGLKNLSSLGQGLLTSTSIGEIVFAIVIAILGLVLFALLISNMQKYLQSTTIRQEEWRTRRNDTEQWMHHRQLPQELRDSVRRYDQYKWVATRGVDEAALLNHLPADLHRKIKRHLCLHLICRVPLFADMDEIIQDLILDRLKPSLYTKGTLLVREGDPVREMIFIIRGDLNSFSDGANAMSFNSCRNRQGEFCGDGLLAWSLDPSANVTLPTSHRTIQAVSEVEAFAITAEDLRDVCVHKRMRKEKLRHLMRFYSHEWRTSSACCIQHGWHRFKRRRNAAEINRHM